MKERNHSIDLLRSLAILAVLIVHVAGFYVDKLGGTSISNWWFAHGVDSALRFCVPVFVMISGVLLLWREESYGIFIKKRLTRVLLPYIIWNTCYVIVTNIYTPMSIAQIFQDLIFWGSSIYWFVFMIVWLYCFIPIINPWIRKAKREDLYFFLLLWSITSNIQIFLPQVSFGWDFRYFSGFLGYAILWYVLSQSNITKTYLFPLFYCLGFMITLIGTYFSVSFYWSMNQFYDYTSFGVILLSSWIFGTIWTTFRDREIPRIFSNISSWSYGIYLVHPFWLSVMIFMPWTHYPAWYIVPWVSIFIFIMSVLTLIIAKKIPKIWKFTQ